MRKRKILQPTDNRSTINSHLTVLEDKGFMVLEISRMVIFMVAVATRHRRDTCVFFFFSVKREIQFLLPGDKRVLTSIANDQYSCVCESYQLSKIRSATDWQIDIRTERTNERTPVSVHHCPETLRSISKYSISTMDLNVAPLTPYECISIVRMSRCICICSARTSNRPINSSVFRKC